MKAALACATKAMLPMNRLLAERSATLAEVGDRKDRHTQSRGHLADWLQHRTEFGVAVAVDLAEIRADRIDDDQVDIPDALDRLLEQPEGQPGG